MTEILHRVNRSRRLASAVVRKTHRRTRQVATVLVGTVSSALVLAGCGGGSQAAEAQETVVPIETETATAPADGQTPAAAPTTDGRRVIETLLGDPQAGDEEVAQPETDSNNAAAAPLAGPVWRVLETDPGRADPRAAQTLDEVPRAAPLGLVRARVTQIVDGDTIDVEVGGQNERVDLIGVATPDVATTDGDRAAEYTWSAARDAGGWVWLRLPSGPDRNGQGYLRREVWLDIPNDPNNPQQRQGFLLNQWLLINHFAAPVDN